MKAPLVFAPVTRWVLAWPDGSHVRTDDAPKLFVTKAEAQGYTRYLNVPPGAKPVKVRVTIEVAK